MRKALLTVMLLSCPTSFGQSHTVKEFLKLKIDNWVAFKLSNAEFMDEENCNYDSLTRHEDYPNTIGFEGIVDYYFGDFDKDGDTDCIFLYRISQCDGGNAIWYDINFGLVINYENTFAQVKEEKDLYFNNINGSWSNLITSDEFDGFLVFDKITYGNQLVLKEFIWSENALRYPDLERLHYFRFEKGMEMSLEKSTDITEAKLYQ